MQITKDEAYILSKFNYETSVSKENIARTARKNANLFPESKDKYEQDAAEFESYAKQFMNRSNQWTQLMKAL